VWVRRAVRQPERRSPQDRSQNRDTRTDEVLQEITVVGSELDGEIVRPELQASSDHLDVAPGCSTHDVANPEKYAYSVKI
jgi:hypothetical protein